MYLSTKMIVQLHLNICFTSTMKEKRRIVHDKMLDEINLQKPETTIRNVLKGHTVFFNYPTQVSKNDIVVQFNSPSDNTNDMLKRINLAFLRHGMAFKTMCINKDRLRFLNFGELLQA